MPEIGRKAPTAQLLGAILIPVGQELDHHFYLSYLADRVQMMLEREEDPKQALRELVWELESEGLLGGGMPQTNNLQEAGWTLIMENLTLQMRLGELGVPGKLPKKIYGGNPAAKKIVEETSLQTWVNYVTHRPHDSLR